jgi:formylglycine-generating enzyme required for sulfatase activity
MQVRHPLCAALTLAFALSSLAPVSAQAPEATLRLDLGSGVTMDLVLVKAGSFRQGSPATEPDRGDDEAQREVTLTKDFYIGRHEVTVAQFRRFVEATGHKTEAEKGTSGGFGWNGQALEQRSSFNWKNPGFPQTDDHPVTIVTFDDAVAFTRWLSGKALRAVSLPSEAQWEFAARANSTSAYPSGAAKATQAAALGWSKANAMGGTHPVGGKSPNGIGLCLDWYGPYEAGLVTDPLETRQNLSDKPRRVLRGGSWLRDPKNGRSAARHRNAPGTRNADNGFRVVASTTSGPAAAAARALASDSATGSKAPSPNSSDLSTPQALGVFALALLAGAGTLVVGWRIVSWFVRSLVTRLFLGDTPAGVSTAMGEDGFILKAPRVPIGHRIHYRYTVDGETQTGSTVFSGDSDLGQTIYTGSRPSSVQVFAVTAPGQALPVEKPRPARAVDDRAVARTDDDSFRGYPSAYR